MGRYTVPQYDHDDDGDDPMEWEDLVPDSNDHNGNHDQEDNAYLNGIGSQLQDMHMNGNHGRESSQHSLVCYESTAAGGTADNHFNNHHEEDAPTQNNSHGNQAMLQLMAEQYMSQSNQYIIEQEQLQQSRQRRRRIQTFTVILVALIAIVLKRYAPPPPPLVLNHQSTLSEAFSSSVDQLFRNDLEGSGIDNSDIVQHETWADYSHHILHLVHHATVYGMSVIWYTTSNSFKYAIDEAKDLLISGDNVGLIGVLTSFGDSVKKLTRKKNHEELKIIPQKQPTSNGDGMANNNTSSATCPIHMPAANDRKIPWFTTEDFLRQTIGSSLSPQNLALKVISKSLDAWGKTDSESGSLDKSMDDAVLPPATGFLLVGPTGVGKLHTARRMAHLLLGHCASYSDDESKNAIEEEELDGVLEVIARDDDDAYKGNIAEQQQQAKERIVNHILRRKGLGSVIILHHIEELLPIEMSFELSQVFSGKSDTLSYYTPSSAGGNDLVKKEVSCHGTVFILTSKQWGTENILQHIRSNDGLINGLNRKSLISSIRKKVNSQFLDDGGMELSSHITVAPFLPFQQDDVAAILQRRIQALNNKYQKLHLWKRLDVSYATIKHSVGVDHVRYLDLYSNNDHGFGEEDDEGVNRLLSYAARGAHALDTNALWQALKKQTRGTEQRPDRVLNVRYIETYNDDLSVVKDLAFFWCGVGKVGLKDCQKEEE